MSPFARTPGARRALRVLLCVVACVLVWGASTRSAFAEPPEPDEEALRPTLREPIEAAHGAPALSIDLAAALGVTDERSVLSFGLLLTGTFDDLLVPARWRVGDALAKKGEPVDGSTAEEAPAPAPRVRTAVVDGALARRTVRAALDAAGHSARADELDDLSTRARASGAVPEVRLRVARVVDEGQSLSPTEYDPDRVTATGGSSLWLEGRVTFQLDRLVFASDEIAIERLRAEQAKQERELVRDVLEALAAYERACAASADETADVEARERAELDAVVLEARLDVLTGGWFGARRDRGIRVAP